MLKFALLIFENASRNIMRTVLTALGTMMLVCVVTGVWSILEFLQNATSEKTSNIKAIVTERWRLPSQMPFAYAQTLREGAVRNPGDIKPTDSMTWTFFGGSLSKESRSFEDAVFAFCMEPEKLMTMMDDLDTLQGQQKVDFEQVVAKLQANPQGIILGEARLKKINKRVGERFTLYGLNYKDIELEVEIVGVFPPGRYDSSAVMRIDYFNRALFDAYPLTHNGQAHPLAERSLNLVWIRVPDTQSFTKVAEQIMSSPNYGSPAVKVETASSGISTFLEAYRDIFWAMRWLLAPSIIITLSLVISNAISISVRERRMEFAVMKVLGFRPVQILFLVIGEALFIGATAGLLSAGLTYYLVNNAFGGIAFPIAFFPAFFISDSAPIWGLLIGAGAALIGSFLPAWDACRVKVAEVFGRVA
ncbi:MAG TPA: ABC transporter permease [Pirellulaceae bacterium]|nr:ABC transporter permease [Pirellulaceae bacterium]